MQTGQGHEGQIVGSERDESRRHQEEKRWSNRLRFFHCKTLLELDGSVPTTPPDNEDFDDTHVWHLENGRQGMSSWERKMVVEDVVRSESVRMTEEDI